MALLLLPVLTVLAACAGGAEPGGSVNQPPQTAIARPSWGATYPESTAVTFVGSSIDPEDGPLAGPALEWSSSIDGPLGTGDSITVPYLSAGAHDVTLRGTDGGGAKGEVTVLVVVSRAGSSTPGLLPIAQGLSAPVFLTHAPGDRTMLFVVEKTGKIRVIRNGGLLSTPFLDLTDSVSTGSDGAPAVASRSIT